MMAEYHLLFLVTHTSGQEQYQLPVAEHTAAM